MMITVDEAKRLLGTPEWMQHSDRPEMAECVCIGGPMDGHIAPEVETALVAFPIFRHGDSLIGSVYNFNGAMFRWHYYMKWDGNILKYVGCTKSEVD